VLCHASFPWSQDELVASTSSSSKVSSCRLPSRTKIKIFNLHHHHRPPSPDRSTPTLYCNKKVILPLNTLSTTQPRLHFASSLDRALRHRRSTCHHRSLSPSSHAHHPHKDTHDDELADPLLLSEQLIDM
jgi:hypothetical protein